MNREIKFRAIEMDTCRLVYGYYVAEHGYWMGNGVPDLNKPVVRHYILGDSGKHDVCEEMLCQYSGLKDKNSADIYEGDIVKSLGESDYRFGVRVVEFIDGKFTVEGYGLISGLVEVIGNIYENPELLEADNATN